MKKRKLFALEHFETEAYRYFDSESKSDEEVFFEGDVYYNGDFYLYATEEECLKKAQELDAPVNKYNKCYLYEHELSEQEILEISGFDRIEDFDRALAEPYSTNHRRKNFGEEEKENVARVVWSESESCDEVACANYDFETSLEGVILVFWKWCSHGRRKCIEIRRGIAGETKALLAPRPDTEITRCDIVLAAEEEAEAGEHLRDVIIEKLLNSKKWKWKDTGNIEEIIDDFIIAQKAGSAS